MTITELTPDDFGSRFEHAPHLFNTVGFTELNRYKADAVHYLLFADTRTRGGIILGERGGQLLSPFSAPFGWLSVNRTPGINLLDDMHSALAAYATDRGMGLHLTLPPVWHNPSLISAGIQSLSRIKGSTIGFELCYHIHLSQTTDVTSGYASNARGALRQALANDFRFTRLTLDEAGIARCYTLIKRNHDQRGFPVRMSLPDMTATAFMVNADLFALSLGEEDVAAAIVFETLPGVAQPILWGDLCEYHHMRTMNRLAYELTLHYRDRGYSVLDLGPSTENLIPNRGLCSFKESLGFESSLKAVWHMENRATGNIV